MEKIKADLKTKLLARPEQVINLIVRLTDSASAHLDAIRAHGLTVTQTYSLISAVAVQGKASDCLFLIDQAWVLAIEEDKPVHTM